MNRFKSAVAGVAVVAALASGAVAVFAQGPRGGGPGGPGGFAGHGRSGGFHGGRDGGGSGLALRGLDLTDAQKQQIRAIRQQERDSNRALQQRLRAARDAHRKATERVPVDEGLIRQTTDALAEVQAEVAITRAYVYNHVWAVLTQGQQAKVVTQRATRDARLQERRQNRQERRQHR